MEKPLAVTEAHPAGACDLAYLQAGAAGPVRLLTCGPDGKLCFRCAGRGCDDQGPWPAGGTGLAPTLPRRRRERRRNADKPSQVLSTVPVSAVTGADGSCTCVAVSEALTVAAGDKNNFATVRAPSGSGHTQCTRRPALAGAAQ